MKLTPRIPRSVPEIPAKVKPWRSEEHLRFIRSLPCAASGRTGGVDAHHLIHTEKPDGTIDIRGGRRRGDDLTMPLAHDIHMKAHASGRPEQWLLETYGLLCRELCAALMAVSGDYEAGLRVIHRARADAALKLRQFTLNQTGE